MSTMKQKTMGDEVVSGNGKKDKIKFKDNFIKITLLTYYMFSGHIVYVIVQCDGGSMEYSDLNYTICYHVILKKNLNPIA